MQLMALMVVLVLAGLLIGRMGVGLSPQPGPIASPSQMTRQAEQATEAASQAERQHLEDAMKALR